MTIKYHVLSIDGGGVRGIIPARILKELETRTGKEIHELFDFVTGTSTGGIIAIAVACKLSSDAMLDLYINNSSNVFPRSIFRDVKTFDGLLAPKYNRQSLDNLLDKYFGEKLLSEVSLSTYITSYDLDTASPKIWSSTDAVSSNASDAKLKDIAGATSAAPTYFALKKFQDMAGNTHNEIDGGIFLNNPPALALDEIIKNVPGAKRDEILLVSIGTGRITQRWDVESLKDAGILGWIKGGQIISAMMDGNSDFASLQASILYPYMYRLQVDLSPELGDMDNSSPENLNSLLNKAEEYIKNNDALFTQIAQELTSKPSEHIDNARALVSSIEDDVTTIV